MKRLLNLNLWPLALAAVLTGCSSQMEEEAPAPPSKAETAAAGMPVDFSAYTQRAITRAGLQGDLDDDRLKLPEGDGGGFGVFAYYTDRAYYTQQARPEFMWNQGVFWSGSLWTYAPVKYWPNEYGDDAHSADEDKVTFFAYAPFTGADPEKGWVTGDATEGITAVTRNTTAGDPMVRYIGSFVPAQGVDLCWAVCEEADWRIIHDNGVQTMEPGFPWLDVEHPAAVDQKMKFTFRHALAQLNVQIDADADIAFHNEVTQIGTKPDGTVENGGQTYTRIYVRSITFSGLAQKGALNLNNTEVRTPLWMDYNGQGAIGCNDCSGGTDGSVTIHDGRRDGREGRFASDSEKNVCLNPAIVQDDTGTEGVTHQLKNLFDVSGLGDLDDEGRLTAPIMVIPTGKPVTVTISYDIETADPKLTEYLSDGATHGSSIGNVITKEVTFSSGADFLRAGYKHTLKLHLGLNSVKFDAAVEDWDDTAAEASKWLPNTTPPGLSMTMTVPAGGGGTATQPVTDATVITRPLNDSPLPVTVSLTPDDDNDITLYNEDSGVGNVTPVGGSSRAGTRGSSQEFHGVKSFTITPVNVGTTHITVTSAAGSITFTYTVIAPAGLGATTSDWSGDPETVEVTEAE